MWATPCLRVWGDGAWDMIIRERGWVLFEEGRYHLWYTGYPDKEAFRQVGYATSPDIYDENAIAADFLAKISGKYYLYYVGTGQGSWDDWFVCLAISEDLIHWEKHRENPVGYYGSTRHGIHTTVLDEPSS